MCVLVLTAATIIRCYTECGVDRMLQVPVTHNHVVLTQACLTTIVGCKLLADAR